MNGAMAEVLARINKPPSRAIITKMGSIQNFFRARIKDQSSPKIDTGILLKKRLLKLICHALRRGARRLPGKPIAGGLRVAFQAQKVFAHPAQNPSERCESEIEERAQHHRIRDAMQQHAEGGPDAV